MPLFRRPSLEDPAQEQEAPSAAPAEVMVDSPRGDVPRPRLYGQTTTFGSVPWWDKRGWWKVSGDGEGNDVRCHVGTYAGLSVAAVSLRGNKHRLQGGPNQDSYCIRTGAREEPGTETLIAVVCDGMGSAPFSGFGARLSAHLMADHVSRMVATFPPDEMFDSLVKFQGQLLEKITQEVAEYRAHEFEAPKTPAERCDINQMQCTMTIAIVFPAGANGVRQGILGFVGDSPAFQLIEQTWVSLESVVKGDGLWSSSTQGFLGSDQMLFAPIELYTGEGILLSSDGIGNFLTFNGEPTLLGRDLATLWSAPVPMLDFVRDASFELQSADDDRTAVMIWA